MDDFEEKFGPLKIKQLKITEEAIKDLFHRIPFGEKIHLSNGLIGEIKVFFEPKYKAKDEFNMRWEAGIDIKFNDGSHLEFILANTGWGAPY